MARFFENIIQRNEMMRGDSAILSKISTSNFVEVGGSAFRAVAVCLLNDLDGLTFEKNKVLIERLNKYFDDSTALTDQWGRMSTRQKFVLVDALTMILSEIAFNEFGTNPLRYSELFLDERPENWVDLMRLQFAKPDIHCITALARVLELQIEVYSAKSSGDVYVVTKYGSKDDNRGSLPLIIFQLQDTDCFKPLVTDSGWYNMLTQHEWAALPFDPNLMVTPRNLSELKRRVFQSFESLKERFVHTSAGINAMVLAGDLTLKDIEAIYRKGLDELSEQYTFEGLEHGTQWYFERVFRAIGYKVHVPIFERSYEEQVLDRLRDGIVRLICVASPDLVDNYLDERSSKAAETFISTQSPRL